MAATVTLVYNTNDFVPQQQNSERCALATVLFDSSYPTGGESVVKTTDLGLLSTATVTASRVTVQAGLAAGFGFGVWDDTNSLLLLYDAAGAQVANTTDASSVTCLLELFYTE